MGYLGTQTLISAVRIQSRTLAPVQISIWDGQTEIYRVLVTGASLYNAKITPVTQQVGLTCPVRLSSPTISLNPTRAGVWHIDRGHVLHIVVGRSEDERQYQVELR